MANPTTREGGAFSSLDSTSERTETTVSLPTFDGSSIDPRIIDLGLLLGLLTSPKESPGDQQTVNTGWFSGIPGELGQIPQRAVPLLDLLQRLLGSLGASQVTEPDGTTVSPVRLWFPIPYGGKPTPFSIIVPQTTADAGNLISLGFSTTFTEGAFTAYVYGVVPIFQVPEPASSVFVLGQTAAPIELHFTITQGKSDSVNGFELASTFSFHDKPTFSLQFLAGTTPSEEPYTVLSQLMSGNGMALLNDIAAVDACQTFLNKAIGTTTATPGSILGPDGLGFLAKSGTTWTVTDLTPFEGKSTVQFAMTVIRTILNAVASSAEPLIPVGTPPKGDPATGIYVQAESDGNGGTDYGFRITLPPLELPVDSPGEDPTLTLRIGDWLSGETTTPSDTTWWSRAAEGSSVPAEPEPGVTLFLVNANSSGTLSFTGKLEIASVGVDYEPPAQQQLVNLDGFTLGGVEARGYVKLDFTASPTVVAYGGALLCQQIGLPLGPSFSNAGGVASTVLAAGGSGDPQSNQPVNPAFSISAAFVSGSTKPVAVQLYDASGTPESSISLPVQRSFGPLHLETLGASWQGASNGNPATFTLDIDGGIALGPLSVELTDLSITMPPTDPLDASGYSLGLEGFNLSFSSGAVSLDAGLVKSNDQYIGEAALKAGEFAIGAIGAFGSTGGAPSLFVFGWTNEPIGGPPFFFVTGLAAGFGYNRALNLPTVDQVQQFPLLAAFAGSDPFGGGSQLDQATSALNSLVTGNFVPETRGEYWLVAGVQFTSFELLHSSVLLAIEFGPDLTIALLGLTKFQLGSIESPYIYVELELEASLKPTDGVLLVQAVLSANSYVLDPACHLTGGFAFALWFGSNPHAGDFVVTVGGYHPLFTPPDYYPVVPRLAISWAVGDSVSIQGDAYFALTPGCVMAGGGLQASYHSGNLRAWLDAQADVLVQWRPFRFLADISISIGVSYKIHLLFINTTLTVQLGASLALWGPPTGGTVSVDWYIISFTIPFGSSGPDDDGIAWSDFVSNLVPSQPAPDSASPRRLGAMRQGGSRFAELTSVTTALQPRIDVQLTAGTVRQDPTAGWIVRADGLAFTIRSSVPARDVTFLAGASSSPPVGSYTMGIVPLKLASVTSGLAVTVTPVPGGTGKINGTFTAAISAPNLPAALWGAAAATMPSSAMVAIPVGLDVSADPYPAVGVAPIAITTLEYDIIDPQTSSGDDAPPAPLPLSPNATIAPVSGVESDGSLSVIQTTLMSPTATELRIAVLSAAADFGLGTGLFDAPAGLAQNITVNLRAPTMLGTPAGITWPLPTTTARRIA